MVVKDRNVNLVKQLICFLDGGGGDRGIAMLAQDRSAKVQIHQVVVEQENVDCRGPDEFEVGGCGRFGLHGKLDARGAWRATLLLVVFAL